MADTYSATGRRKESVARVRVMAPGTGKQTVNGRPLDAYFGRRNLIIEVRQPLEYVDMMDSVTSTPPSPAAASPGRRARCAWASPVRCWRRTRI